MFKYLNSSLISINRSYTVEQICKIYADKNLHPQTIREWVRNGFLKSISASPLMICGPELKTFIAGRNAAKKRTLEFDEFKCLGCKAIYSPKHQPIMVYRRANRTLRATCLCEKCGRTNSRFYGRDDESRLHKIFDVKLSELATICNPSTTNTKTHIETPLKTAQSESIKKG